MATYPDITDILTSKAEQRKQLAALSWEEKVAIVVRMRNALPKGVWGERRSGNGSVVMLNGTLSALVTVER